MNWVILLLMYVVAGVIIYQDITSRGVVWLLFPVLFAFGIIYSRISQKPWNDILTDIAINTGFLIIQLLLLKTYFIFHRGTGHLVGKKIGWGDILFLLSCCAVFSPGNFLIFYSMSLLFSLIVFLSFKIQLSAQRKYDTIPLAGLQAIFLVLFLFACSLIKNDITRDDWIIKFSS